MPDRRRIMPDPFASEYLIDSNGRKVLAGLTHEETVSSRRWTPRSPTTVSGFGRIRACLYYQWSSAGLSSGRSTKLCCWPKVAT